MGLVGRSLRLLGFRLLRLIELIFEEFWGVGHVVVDIVVVGWLVW